MTTWLFAVVMLVLIGATAGLLMHILEKKNQNWPRHDEAVQLDNEILLVPTSGWNGVVVTHADGRCKARIDLSREPMPADWHTDLKNHIRDRLDRR